MRSHTELKKHVNFKSEKVNVCLILRVFFWNSRVIFISIFVIFLGITIFGTSAKLLDLIEKKGIIPRKMNNLATLRSILSTGSPLKPNSFDYVYRDIKSDLLLGSITGKTKSLLKEWICFTFQTWILYSFFSARKYKNFILVECRVY